MWLNQLKIAIIEQDIKKLNELMENLPHLESKEELDTAICLIEEAKGIVVKLRDETKSSMIKMRNNIKFLKSTQEKRTSRFDIKS